MMIKHQTLFLTEAAHHPQAEALSLAEAARAKMGGDIEKTPEGFLLNYSDWTPDLAEILAQENNLTLTQDHWEILNFVRAYYLEKQISPGLRELIKAIKPILGAEKSNSLYLFKLFPDGAAKQISKLAGLPKPAKCI